MLTAKDIGKRVICAGPGGPVLGRLEAVNGEMCTVRLVEGGTWIGSGGWTLAARLRRWAEAHTPAGVTATALRALLSEAADEIERLAGVTAVQAEQAEGCECAIPWPPDSGEPGPCRACGKV